MRCTALRVLGMNQYRARSTTEMVRTSHSLIFGRAGKCKGVWCSKGRSMIPSVSITEQGTGRFAAYHDRESQGYAHDVTIPCMEYTQLLGLFAEHSYCDPN
jgi:hypothetical protein